MRSDNLQVSRWVGDWKSLPEACEQLKESGSEGPPGWARGPLLGVVGGVGGPWLWGLHVSSALRLHSSLFGVLENETILKLAQQNFRNGMLCVGFKLKIIDTPLFLVQNGNGYKFFKIKGTTEIAHHF